MTINKKKLGWSVLQVAVGCVVGVLIGWVSLTLIDLVWQGLQQLSLGGFLTGLLLLISFLIILGATIASTAESVLFMGRFIPRSISRKRIYEGAFLGICAAVAILTVTRGDWMGTLDEWGAPFRLVATLFYLIIVLPIKLVTFWIPSLFLIFVSAPIGATIGYNLPPYMKKKSKKEDLGTQLSKEGEKAKS
jgi:hypothetical protein